MLSSRSFSQQKHAAGSAEIRGYEKIQTSTFPTPSLSGSRNDLPVPPNWLQEVNAAPVLCTVTAQQGCSPNLTGCSALAQVTPTPADKDKGVIPLASETPEHQPIPVGCGFPHHKLLWQPSPHPPACLHALTLTTRGALLTQKGEGIRHCTG